MGFKDKLKEKVGYDQIVKNKDMMKDASFNHKDLLIAIFTGFFGLSLFIVTVDVMWINITVKLIGVALMINAFGLILGCFKFDEVMKQKLDDKMK